MLTERNAKAALSIFLRKNGYTKTGRFTLQTSAGTSFCRYRNRSLRKRDAGALQLRSSDIHRMTALRLCNAFCAYRGEFSNYGVLDLALFSTLKFQPRKTAIIHPSFTNNPIKLGYSCKSPLSLTGRGAEGEGKMFLGPSTSEMCK